MKPDHELDNALRAVDAATTSDQLMEATARLVRCRQLKAVPKLLEVIGYNNPALAGLAMGGLIALGKDAAPEILRNLDPQNYGARAWAVKALAEIGDDCALDTLIRAVDSDIGPSVRRAAAKGLGRLSYASDPTEASKQRDQCLEALVRACSDGEWVVRYAACVSLEIRLAEGRPYADAIQAIGRLTEPTEPVKVVRMRAIQALERINAS